MKKTNDQKSVSKLLIIQIPTYAYIKKYIYFTKGPQSFDLIIPDNFLRVIMITKFSPARVPGSGDQDASDFPFTENDK